MRVVYRLLEVLLTEPLASRDTVSGERADTAVGLDGNHATIAMLQDARRSRSP